MNFAQEIIEWYQVNKRDLPWRKTRDPYIIWLSEIIMQQTRVEQGMPYFERFAEKYPTVNDFASAEESEILKQWEGLGYYSRGRNMHLAAKTVVGEYGGEFPQSYTDLIRLKGIGEYTAAAISSFSALEPRAVVDGNVFRLLSRFYGISIPINSATGKTFFTSLANDLMDQSQPDIFNQAIMEFGSLQCRPKSPRCYNCPLQLECVAFATGKTEELPVKIKQKKPRVRYFNYFFYVDEGKVLMNRRGPDDIWENLYEMPLIETQQTILAEDIISEPDFSAKFGDLAKIVCTMDRVTHLLSHQKLITQFFQLEDVSTQSARESGLVFVDSEVLKQVAQPKLIFHFFNNFLKLN